MEIKFVGNKKTNKSTRSGRIPTIIVNHITEGSQQSCIQWFTSDKNQVSSAHFLVGKEGEIFQFVPIEEMAWANGLPTKENPNLWSVSIEHEGIFSETKGALSPGQFESSVWLHNYIINYVERVYGYVIPKDRKHILGHCDIDPIRKPNCPGPRFPYDEIIKLLQCKDMIGHEIEGHFAEKELRFLINRGILKGYPDGTIRPNHPITRGELAITLYRYWHQIETADTDLLK